MERRKGFLEGSRNKNQERCTELDVAETDLIDFDPRARANPLSDHHEEKTRVRTKWDEEPGTSLLDSGPPEADGER